MSTSEKRDRGFLAEWQERWQPEIDTVRGWFEDYSAFRVVLGPEDEHDAEGGGGWRAVLTVTYAWGKNKPITFTYPVRMTDTGYVEYNRYEDVWVELGRIDLLESMFLDLARRFWDRQDTRIIENSGPNLRIFMYLRSGNENT